MQVQIQHAWKCTVYLRVAQHICIDAATLHSSSQSMTGPHGVSLPNLGPCSSDLALCPAADCEPENGSTCESPTLLPKQLASFSSFHVQAISGNWKQLMLSWTFSWSSLRLVTAGFVSVLNKEPCPSPFSQNSTCGHQVWDPEVGVVVVKLSATWKGRCAFKPTHDALPLTPSHAATPGLSFPLILSFFPSLFPYWLCLAKESWFLKQSLLPFLPSPSGGSAPLEIACICQLPVGDSGCFLWQSGRMHWQHNLLNYMLGLYVIE